MKTKKIMHNLICLLMIYLGIIGLMLVMFKTETLREPEFNIIVFFGLVYWIGGSIGYILLKQDKQ